MNLKSIFKITSEQLIDACVCVCSPAQWNRSVCGERTLGSRSSGRVSGRRNHLPVQPSQSWASRSGRRERRNPHRSWTHNSPAAAIRKHSLTLTHARTHARTHAHTLSHTLSHTDTLSHTHTHTHTHKHTLSLTHTHTHTDRQTDRVIWKKVDRSGLCVMEHKL